MSLAVPELGRSLRINEIFWILHPGGPHKDPFVVVGNVPLGFAWLELRVQPQARFARCRTQNRRSRNRGSCRNRRRRGNRGRTRTRSGSSGLLSVRRINRENRAQSENSKRLHSDDTVSVTERKCQPRGVCLSRSLSGIATRCTCFGAGGPGVSHAQPPAILFDPLCGFT